jgi:hypothetical protein
MDDSELTGLHDRASAFRRAIEMARAERLPGALPYFPEGACRMASRALARHLVDRPDHAASGPVRLVSGVLPGSELGVRHYWLEVADAVVDITADPFGEAPVVVGSRTPFHRSLTSITVEDATQVLAALSAGEAAQISRQLAAIESRLRVSA